MKSARKLVMRSALPLFACLALLVTIVQAADPIRPPKKPKRLLLIAGKFDGHPPATHEFAAGMQIVEKLLADIAGVKITRVLVDEKWAEGPELLKESDGVVLFMGEGARWLSADEKRRAAFVELARRGGGLSALHWGMGCKAKEPIAEFVKLFGGCHGGDDRKYKVLETELQPTEKPHPVTRGMKPIVLKDEFYYRLKMAEGVEPIAQVKIDGAWEQVAWAWQREDGGRSFGFSGLHFHENWRQESYRRLVGQGILWTLHRETPTSGFPPELTLKDLELPKTSAAEPGKKLP